MKLLNTSIIRLTLVLMAGISTGFKIAPSLSLLYFLLATVFLMFGFFYFRARGLFLQDTLFGISCFLLFFTLGILSVQLQLPRNQPLHYSHHLKSEKSVITARVTEVLKSDTYRNKYVLRVNKVDTQPVFGKLLLLVPKDSLSLASGTLVAIASKLNRIPPALNPQQFDYGKFMENRGILYQTFPRTNEIVNIELGETSLESRLSAIHTQLVASLRAHNFENSELSLIQALLLGQRNDISPETYQDFAEAGVIHILAVSGLHVGLILLLLEMLLIPLNHIKGGKRLKVMLLLCFLWAYALLAGLSPSVVRAVSMFSFVVVAMQLKRRTSVINSLFISLMVLLLLRPQWLFEVGFQLSYLAVFSIVLLQPRIAAVYRPRNRFLKYAWNLFTVTLAAQIGVTPLSLFYFHQFPGLFFVSNLLILPFLGLLLGLGILVLFLAYLDALPQFLAELLNSSLWLLQEVVSWVAAQDAFIFRDIPFLLPEVFILYVLLLLVLLFRKVTPGRRLALILIALICIQVTSIYNLERENTRELVIFHKRGQSIIGERQGAGLRMSYNLKTPLEKELFLRNYSLMRKLRAINVVAPGNVYEQGEGLLLVIDSIPVYTIPGIKPQSILLSHSPKMNLERLFRSMSPELIIADGSNSSFLIRKWKVTCQKYGVAFHYTGEKGAYVRKWP